MEFTNIRIFTLSMLNIHAELAYFLSCLPKEDVNRAKSPMEKALDSIANLLIVIGQFAGNFTVEKAVLKELVKFSIAEKNQVTNNNELAAKPLLIEKLNLVLDRLSKIPLN